MSKYLEDIDRISRDTLQEWEIPPPDYIAGKVRRRLFWTNLRRKRAVLAAFLFLGSIGIIAMGAWVVAELQTSTPAGRFSDLSTPAYMRPALTGPDPQTNSSFTTPEVPASENLVPDQNNGNQIPDKQNKKNVLNGGKSANPVADASQGTPIQDAKAENAGLTSDNGQADQVNKENDADHHSTAIVESSVQSLPDHIRTGSLLQMNSLPWREPALSPLHQQNSTTKLRMKRNRLSLQFNLAVQFPGLGEKKKDLVSSQTSMLSGSTSLLLQYRIRNFFIEGGLQYSRLQTRQKADMLTYNPHGIEQQQWVGQELHIDTGGYWHYKWIQDSVIHVYDSVWITEYDSVLQDVYENVHLLVNDTLHQADWKTSISLFELPLGIGYRFYARNTEISLQAGVLLGISSSTQGLLYWSESSAGLVPFSDMYSVKTFQTSWYLGASVSRNISEHWAVLISPAWRSSLTGLRSSEGLKPRHYQSFGLGFGLRYDF